MTPIILFSQQFFAARSHYGHDYRNMLFVPFVLIISQSASFSFSLSPSLSPPFHRSVFVLLFHGAARQARDTRPRYDDPSWKCSRTSYPSRSRTDPCLPSVSIIRAARNHCSALLSCKYVPRNVHLISFGKIVNKFRFIRVDAIRVYMLIHLSTIFQYSHFSNILAMSV